MTEELNVQSAEIHKIYEGHESSTKRIEIRNFLSSIEEQLQNLIHDTAVARELGQLDSFQSRYVTVVCPVRRTICT